MKILAIEFSSPQRSVAVVEPGGQPEVLGLVLDDSPQKLNALVLVEQVLAKAGLEREAIEALAIGLGPGSYTGIRAAIALAEGWQLALSVKVAGASSAECVARAAVRRGWRGPHAVVIDAQRGEFYLAGYQIEASGCALVKPLRLAAREEVERMQIQGFTLIGPEVASWFATARTVFPEAVDVGLLAAQNAEYRPAENLEPVYLRQTQFVKAPPPRYYPDPVTTPASPG